MKQITVKLGKQKKTFVCVKPPYPDSGDKVTISGIDWEVVKSEVVEGLFSVSFPKGQTEAQQNEKARS